MGVTERRNRMERSNVLVSTERIRDMLQQRHCNNVYRTEILVEVNRKKHKRTKKKCKTKKIKVEQCNTNSSEESAASLVSHTEPPSGKHSVTAAAPQKLPDSIVQRVPFQVHQSIVAKCDKVSSVSGGAAITVGATLQKYSSSRNKISKAHVDANLSSPTLHHNAKFSFIPSRRVHCDMIIEEFKSVSTTDTIESLPEVTKKHGKTPRSPQKLSAKSFATLFS